LGGSVGTPVTQQHDPLSCAVRNFIEEGRPKDETHAVVDKYYSEHFYEDQMTHIYLVRAASPVMGDLLKLYCHLESLIYALRRYNDQLRTSHAELDAMISSLYGQCYEVFVHSPVIVHSYLIYDIGQLMLRNQDFVKVLSKMNLHHHMRYMEFRDVNVLVDLHKELHESMHKDKNGVDIPTLNACVVVYLKLVGRRFHYDHELKELKNHLSKPTNSANKIDWKLVDELFAECQKLHKQEEEQDRKQYRENSDYDHMTAIHGYGYDIPKATKPMVEAVKPKKPIRKSAAKK
jgi:hypothetical protein